MFEIYQYKQQMYYVNNNCIPATFCEPSLGTANLICEVYSSHSSVAEDLNLLGYDCMSLKNAMFI
jgi:hypothetical protein